MPKQQASAVDDETVQSNSINQIAVINATLSRIRDWFGDYAISLVNAGNAGNRVVIVLPDSLTICKRCRRIRTVSMLADGICQHCSMEDSDAL